ncbi:hypothetical protein PC116_g27225 [Phytophthora cactorum]|nr:hypothetical protein PC116_g27225 [Phytophthora cactorum]
MTSKLGKFRGLIVSRNLEAAQEVQHEFSLVDKDLFDLLDLRRSQLDVEAATNRSQSHHVPCLGERQRR